MDPFSQANWPMTMTSPFGADLMPLGFNGQEGISQLFRYSIHCVARNRTNVALDRLLGGNITLGLNTSSGRRFFNGICMRATQGERDARHTGYRIEVVPAFWLLTRRAQSRIFQQINVPDILKQVLKGLDPAIELEGTFEPRNFCVQYRETDFNFACRLMEEEGIYYYFKHSDGAHKLTLANTPAKHVAMPGRSRFQYEDVVAGNRPDDRIDDWGKTQELRSGKYLLWDHCFELPHKHLEADKLIQDSVQVGAVSHPLKVADNDKLELFDWPGEYAQRFDGVDPNGGERPADIQKIFDDNKRTVGIRMQEEALASLLISGGGTCRDFVSGHKFTLQRHFNADGEYVAVGVSHQAFHTLAGDGSGVFHYGNTFTCIPIGLPFRPPRVTRKPFVPGSQSAVVVGPKNEEIFTDKYGRVKVQFHWDREGKNDALSSCWVRVGQFWAGKRWGAFFWPRIGQEVIVDFLEGDPDQPIIVGSVYNADQTPPYLGDGPDPKHKNDNKLSGIKTNSTPGGDGYNELRFDDTKDKEQIYIHAERNMDTRVKGNYMTTVGGSMNCTNGGVDKNGNKYGDHKQLVNKDLHLTVKGDSYISTAGKETHIVGGDAIDWYKASHRTTTAVEEFIESPKIILEGGSPGVSIKGESIILEATKAISIKGPGGHIVIDATGVTIVGTPKIFLNSGGSAPTPAFTSSGLGSGPVGDKAKEPEPPAPAASSKSGYRSCK